MVPSENEQKKVTLKIQKSSIVVLVLNQSPISAVSWGPKNRTNRGSPVYLETLMNHKSLHYLHNLKVSIDFILVSVRVA